RRPAPYRTSSARPRHRTRRRGPFHYLCGTCTDLASLCGFEHLAARAQKPFVLTDVAAAVVAGTRQVPPWRGEFRTQQIVDRRRRPAHPDEARGDRAAGVRVLVPGGTEHRKDRLRC